jgi:hypothetical protein
MLAPRHSCLHYSFFPSGCRRRPAPEDICIEDCLAEYSILTESECDRFLIQVHESKAICPEVALLDAKKCGTSVVGLQLSSRGRCSFDIGGVAQTLT